MVQYTCWNVDCLAEIYFVDGHKFLLPFKAAGEYNASLFGEVAKCPLVSLKLKTSATSSKELMLHDYYML